MKRVFRTLRPLVLASGSPRRRIFLEDQGLDFTIELPETEEKPLPGEAPESYVLRAARDKAEQVLRRLGDSPSSFVVIAADTIVVLEEDGVEHILGKPADERAALAMLSRLAERAHTVITACCLLRPDGPAELFADRARVHFAPWPVELLQAYAAAGESLDKAGAYAVQGQGAFLIERIEGSWSTVAGLPLSRVMAALMNIGAVSPAAPGPV